MGFSTWSTEIETAVPAPRLFKAAVMDWHNLGPKIASDKIVSAAPAEGDGGIGSTRQFNFAPGMPFSYVKERLDFIDVEKFEVKSSLVEGGGIGTHVESASSDTAFVPKDGGCVVKVVGSYKPVPGANAEEEAERVKASFVGIIKTAEAYLLANPDAYN
ncbi:pathogenesis-related protein 1-like protein [Carex littledalei]|uniref:Pathogenesis-related protein 1-like protein n=1 Tax=Carex littledalei TaxID=544730 RepID=A0A833V1T7_9POAL|nr:pathogenesis-related protein 1-like protein [Carex littledalei]